MEEHKKCGACGEIKLCDEFRLVKEKRSAVPFVYRCSVCKVCEKQRALQRYHANSEHCREMNKKYKRENKELVNATRKVYLAKKLEIPEERLKRNMKSLISAKLRKTRHTGEYLGAPMTLIVKWLEFNFLEDMSWQNYGKSWHIDHTLPINSFVLQNDQEACECFCWMNLMPLFISYNLRKSDKISPFRVFHQERQLRAFAKQEKIQDIVLPYIQQYATKFASTLMCNMPKLREPP